MGLTFNIAVALFGGTTGFVISALQSVIGSDLAGAYYIMFACLIGGVGVYCMKESAGRNLLGSMPTVDHECEVQEVLESIGTDARYDIDTMPVSRVRH